MNESRRTRVFVSALMSMLLVATSFVVTPAPADAATLPPIGVRAFNQAGVAEYEAWLGRQVSHITAFLEHGSWDKMVASSSSSSAKWKGSRFGVTYSVPMFPQGGSFAAGNNGAYDHYWRTIAKNLTQNDPDGIIRLGWEANGTWFAWTFANDPVGYRNYFRRIVDIFRAEPGSNFEYEWSVARRQPAIDEAAYPGDAYVDIVGMSMYDGSWGPAHVDPAQRWNLWKTYGAGLNWLDAFSKAHNKPMAFAEWAVSTKHIAGVPHDNPSFIQNFHDWLSARAGRVEYANYFERKNNSGDFALMPANTSFPQSAALFRQLFGSATTAPPTTAPPTTTPPTTKAPTTTKPPVTSPPTTKPTPTTAAPKPTTTKAPTPTTAAPKPTPTTTAPKPVPTTVAPKPTAPVPRPSADVCPPLHSTGSATGGSGYWILHESGVVEAFGAAPHHGDLVTRGAGVAAVSLEPSPSGNGYWILGADGAIHAFGDAPHRGDVRDFNLVAKPRNLASGPGGYWLTAPDGGVFSFGTPFHGSMGHVALNAPVVGVTATSSGGGYWLVGGDGGVFAFGDAAFHGSTGGWTLDAPIISMAPASSGGYWLYGADGGVFAFGAAFHGSVRQHSGCGLPVAVELEPSVSGDGYWVAASDGSVYAFGDAPHFGNSSTSSPVVGFAAR